MRCCGRFLVLMFFVCISAAACSGKRLSPTVVKNVDLARYAGTWYEIARFPHSFEKGLVCVTATYTINPDGAIAVVNAGRLERDRSQRKEARAKAWVPDPAEPGKILVQFFWPFRGNYWIIGLDGASYRYAVVAGPSPDYLWILSRSKTMDATLYDSLVALARSQGFDVSRLERVDQGCE